MHPHRARRCSAPTRQSCTLTCRRHRGRRFPSQPCSALQSCTSRNPEVTELLPLRPALRLAQTGHICVPCEVCSVRTRLCRAPVCSSSMSYKQLSALILGQQISMSRLTMKLCCNPSQVTFVFSEHQVCFAGLFLAHRKGTDTNNDFIFLVF